MEVKAMKGLYRSMLSTILLLMLAIQCSGSVASYGQSPTTRGAQSIIVILAEFSDLKHKTTREHIYDLVFVQMNSYYREASYNTTWITGDVTERWYMLPAPFADYGDLTWASHGTKAQQDNRKKLVGDAIQSADQDVDFRKYICVLIVIPVPAKRIPNFASNGWNIPTNDGVKVDRATVQLETVGADTFVHEFGHTLGLRDLYDYDIAAKVGDSSKAAIYAGRWDPMSMTQGKPEHFCAYNKAILGWILPSQVNAIIYVGENKTVKVDPLEIANQSTYAIKIWVGGQLCYFVEVRQQVGFDTVLPDYGVLVYLVDEEKKVGSLSTLSGLLVVKDGNPDTPTLDDATLDLRVNKKAGFFDRERNLSIVVTGRLGLSYTVFVGPVSQGDTMLREIESNIMTRMTEANKTITQAQELETRAMRSITVNTGGYKILQQASDVLRSAEKAFSVYDFTVASDRAKEAITLFERALSVELEESKQRQMMVEYVLVIVAVLIGIGAFAALRKSKKNKSQEVAFL